MGLHKNTFLLPAKNLEQFLHKYFSSWNNHLFCSKLGMSPCVCLAPVQKKWLFMIDGNLKGRNGAKRERGREEEGLTRGQKFAAFSQYPWIMIWYAIMRPMIKHVFQKCVMCWYFLIWSVCAHTCPRSEHLCPSSKLIAICGLISTLSGGIKIFKIWLEFRKFISKCCVNPQIEQHFRHFYCQ